MQKREYIVNGSLINDLGDFIMTFAWFAQMGDGEASELSKRALSIGVTNDEIKERYEILTNKDENLNRFNDYLWQIANPMDGSIQQNDHVLLRILDSDYLRKVLGFDITEKLARKNIKGYKASYPKDMNGIKILDLELKVAQEKIQGNALFDKLILMIIDVKKIRLQLE